MWKVLPGFLLLVLVISCAKKDEATVVSVKNQKLTKEMFIRRFKSSKDYRQNSIFNQDIIKKFVEENLLENLLLLAEVYEKKYDQIPAIANQISEEEKRILTQRNGPLYRQIVNEDIAISDEEIKKYYDQLEREVKFAHIVVTSKKLADSLFILLQTGADFNDLAEKYSIDLGTKDRGGAVDRYFTPGMLGEKFDRIAFDLKVNQIAKPVQTNFGYHLVKLLDSRPVNKKPFDSLKIQIKGHLKEMKINQTSENYLKALLEKYRIVVNPDNAVKIIKRYNQDNRRSQVPSISAEGFTEQELKSNVVTFQGGSWTLADLIKKYNNASRMNQFPLITVADINNFVEKEIMLDILYLEALSLNLDQDGKFQDEFLRVKDLILLRNYRQQVMYENIEVTEAEQKSYYEANKAKYTDRSFEEVKEVIYRELRNNKVKDRLNGLMSELKEKYPVRYHVSVINSIVAELNASKKTGQQ